MGWGGAGSGEMGGGQWPGGGGVRGAVWWGGVALARERGARAMGRRAGWGFPARPILDRVPTCRLMEPTVEDAFSHASSDELSDGSAPLSEDDPSEGGEEEVGDRAALQRRQAANESKQQAVAAAAAAAAAKGARRAAGGGGGGGGSASSVSSGGPSTLALHLHLRLMAAAYARTRELAAQVGGWGGAWGR